MLFSLLSTLSYFQNIKKIEQTEISENSLYIQIQKKELNPSPIGDRLAL
jgi:hypothetical protein